MKTLSRDTKLAIGILVALVIVTIFAAGQRETQQEYPPLSSLSAAPDGARALKLWLEELGYRVDEEVLSSFLPPEDATILLMLEPQFPTEGEIQAMRHRDFRVWGVQFHPESLFSQHGKALLANFLRL